MDIEYHAIGIIHSPFTKTEGMPIQPVGASDVEGTIELLPQYEQGLKDLDGFSHIILLYHFHRCTAFTLLATPFMDSQPRGIFATRAPTRPNPIGLSVVELLKVDKHILHVQGLDVLDGTPLLDIKPYVPKFDQHPSTRVGWLQQTQANVHSTKADDRFA